MGLGHWDYRLHTLQADSFNGHSGNDVTGEVEFLSEMTAQFNVALGRDWGEVKRTVIHECCHVLLRELREQVNTAQNELGGSAWGVVTNGYNTVEERTVLRMTRAFMGALEKKDLTKP